MDRRQLLLALGALAGVVIAAGITLYAIDLVAAPLRWAIWGREQQ
jgi:hypothetical protein